MILRFAFLFFFMAHSEGKRIQLKPGGVNQLDQCCEKGNLIRLVTSV